jgi:hypothetical protein
MPPFQYFSKRFMNILRCYEVIQIDWLVSRSGCILRFICLCKKALHIRNLPFAHLLLQSGHAYVSYVMHLRNQLTSVQLRATYNIVDRVAQYSGVAWSTDSGTNITAESEGLWADIIRVSPVYLF